MFTRGYLLIVRRKQSILGLHDFETPFGGVAKSGTGREVMLEDLTDVGHGCLTEDRCPTRLTGHEQWYETAFHKQFWQKMDPTCFIHLYQILTSFDFPTKSSPAEKTRNQDIRYK